MHWPRTSLGRRSVSWVLALPVNPVAPLRVLQHPRTPVRGPILRAFRAGPAPVPAGSPTARKAGGGAQLASGHSSRCSSRQGQAPAGWQNLGHPPCTPSGSPPTRGATSRPGFHDTRPLYG
jgi:hypothetical protein